MNRFGTPAASAAFTLTMIAWSAVPVAAQTTRVVGPGGFGQIDPAIQASSPGDTILITASARYEHFTLDRGLTIRAAAGVRPLVSRALSGPTNLDTTVRIPAGQTGELVGLLFAPELPLFGTSRIGQVRVTAGTVVFRDCWILGQTNGCGAGWPALEVEDAAVSLQLCRVHGFDTGGFALLARRSTISAVDSTFTGGSGCWDASAFGSDAIRLEASALHASRVTIQGGSSALLNPNYDAGHGVVVDPLSRLWLAYAVAAGGNGGTRSGRGGDGIRNLSAVPVEAVQLTATAGSGAPPGTAVAGPLVVNQALVVTWGSPAGPQLGATWNVRYQLVPQTAIVTLIGLRVDPVVSPVVAETLWLAASPSPIAFAASVANSAGDVAVSIPIPGTPSLRGVRLWSQGAVPGTLPIQLTPLLGGQAW